MNELNPKPGIPQGETPQSPDALEALQIRLGFAETPLMRELRGQIVSRLLAGKEPVDLSIKGNVGDELSDFADRYHTAGQQEVERLVPKQEIVDAETKERIDQQYRRTRLG